MTIDNLITVDYNRIQELIERSRYINFEIALENYNQIRKNSYTNIKKRIKDAILIYQDKFNDTLTKEEQIIFALYLTIESDKLLENQLNNELSIENIAKYYKVTTPFVKLRYQLLKYLKNKKLENKKLSLENKKNED